MAKLGSNKAKFGSKMAGLGLKIAGKRSYRSPKKFALEFKLAKLGSKVVQ